MSIKEIKRIKKCIFYNLPFIQLNEEIFTNIISNNKDAISILLESFIERLKTLWTFSLPEKFISQYSFMLKYVEKQQDLKNIFDDLLENYKTLERHHRISEYSKVIDSNKVIDSKELRQKRIQDLSQNLKNVLVHLPKQILENNSQIFKEFLQTLKEQHNFNDKEIKELNKMLETIIKSNIVQS